MIFGWRFGYILMLLVLGCVISAHTAQANPTTWLWDFGDGTTSTVQHPTHVYTNPGRYDVSLTVTNDWGSDTELKEDYITVLFTDVPTSNWAFGQIMACLDNNIVQGFPDGTYQPSNPVTRDQMAVYTARALAGGDASVPDFTGTPTFPDVPGDFWALKYIEYALAQGVVGGYTDGTYQPTGPVDRGQMAVYMARALVAPLGEAGLADYLPANPRNFPDVPADLWCYKHVEYCVEHGVVSGYEDGAYRPNDLVTRDQMAVYVARAFDLGL